MPEFDNVLECLIACVKAAGGSKAVAQKVWPTKTLDSAQRHLLNCLDDSRAERLAPDQVLFIAGLARDAGCHAYMQYLAQHLHYAAPVPREPAQELAQLQHQFAQMVAQQQVLLGQIQTVMGSLPASSAGLKVVA